MDFGHTLGHLFRYIEPLVFSGISTLELNDICDKYIRESGYTPSIIGYCGYKHATCISVNNTLVHGVPDSYIIKPDDIVTVDVVITDGKTHRDASYTYVQKGSKGFILADVALQCLRAAVGQIKPNQTTVGDIGRVIEQTASEYDCYPSRIYGGHYIGKDIHQYPFIPNYTNNSKQPLRAGDMMCIEPIVYAKPEGRLTHNGWCVNTDQLSAHVEHTILITDSGVDILTD